MEGVTMTDGYIPRPDDQSIVCGIVRTFQKNRFVPAMAHTNPTRDPQRFLCADMRVPRKDQHSLTNNGEVESDF